MKVFSFEVNKLNKSNFIILLMNKAQYEGTRGVNESPLPAIFVWPDINSSKWCVVSYSHWSRHDITLQTF